jgi:hypothetical protein
MKKVLLVLAIILGSTVSITGNANASDCNATNGCGDWAMVDSTGTVVANVVCQESVCGANGSWAGKVPVEFGCKDCTYVLQVPASKTGEYQGSFISPLTDASPVKYDVKTNTFSQEGKASTLENSTDFSNHEAPQTIETSGNVVKETVVSSTTDSNISIYTNYNKVAFTPSVVDETNKPIINLNSNYVTVSSISVSRSETTVATTSYETKTVVSTGKQNETIVTNTIEAKTEVTTSGLKISQPIVESVTIVKGTTVPQVIASLTAVRKSALETYNAYIVRKLKAMKFLG